MKNDKKYTITSVSKSDNTKTDIQITPNFREYSDKMVDNPIFISFSDNPMEENGYRLTLGAAKRLAKDLIIKPFKNDVNYIAKVSRGDNLDTIAIDINDCPIIYLPPFEKTSLMYKNMKINTGYTLQKLNLM